jgi:acetyl esterase/lipase
VRLPEQVEVAVARLIRALPPSIVRALAGAPVFVDGQRLEPEARLAQRILDLDPPPPIETLPVLAARARLERDARVFSGPRVEVDAVRDLDVAGAAGRLPARLYAGRAEAPSALLVYFHGGGWTMGSIDSHDNLCRFLAREAGIRVLSVGYRLAPESPFPAAAEDALASFREAVARAGELGAPGAGAVAVGGDSAGANLAAVASLLAREDGGPIPALQLLIYPVVQVSGRERRSYRLFGEGFYLTTREMDWYDQNYLPEPERAGDWRASPLLAEDLSGLPPAVVAIAGFDPLRDEAEEYARRLAEAGVAVDVHRVPGLPHGFANAANAGRAPRAAMGDLAGALRAALVRAHAGDATERLDLTLDERG